jgi:hypothetical protein
MMRPKELYPANYYTLQEMHMLIEELRRFNLPAEVEAADFVNRCSSAWEEGWKVTRISSLRTRYLWQMSYFSDRDAFNIHGLLFHTPLEEMPLAINSEFPADIIAKWRMEIAK